MQASAYVELGLLPPDTGKRAKPHRWTALVAGSYITRPSTANAAGYVVRASSYPRHRFSSGFYPFFALSVFPQSKCVLASSECARVDGAKRHQREPFQWSCDGSDIIFIEVRHIPTGMVRYDDRSAQAILLHSNEARTISLRENWNIEASRTIAGALTRLWLRCV